jgi:hypothetical protein
MEVGELSEILKQMQADLRPEVVARELIEADFSETDDTIILPREAFKRSYSRDVSALEEEFVALDGTNKAIRVVAVREGMVDMVPPGLFYQPAAGRERSEQVMQEDAETQATGFSQAQQFFYPFDAEAGKVRIALELFENQSVTNPNLVFGDLLFEYLWPDSDLELSAFQKLALLDLGYRVEHIAGDLSQVAAEIGKILEVSVKIKPVEKRELERPSDLMPLGKSILGVNWAPFEDLADAENICIEIGPLNSIEISHFRHHQPEGKNYRLLRFLCDLLLPVEISWQVMLVPGEQTFEIGKKNELGILSYSTVLG